jgi:hypothetical protein
VALGAVEGLDDQEHAIALLVDGGGGVDAVIAYNNLGVDRWGMLGPEAALATYSDGMIFAAQRRLDRAADNIRASRLQATLETGRLAEAYADAEALLPALRQSGSFLIVECLAIQARIRYEQGLSGSGPAQAALAQARQIGSPDVMASAGLSSALTSLAAGDRAAAVDVLVELAELASLAPLAESPEFAPRLPALVRCAVAVGEPEVGRRLSALLEPSLLVRRHACTTAQALLAQADGDLASAEEGLVEAVSCWDSFGNRLEHAYALLALAGNRHARGLASEEPARAAYTAFSAMGAARGAGQAAALLPAGGAERLRA